MYTMTYTIEQSEIAVRNFWRRWVTMTLREGTLTELHFLAYWYRRDWREL